MDPSLTTIRAQDQPEGATALEQLDLIALVEDADLPRAKFVRRVEEADQPVADVAALVVVERSDAGGLERKTRLLRHGTKRVVAADLLQRRPAPARQQRLVNHAQAGRSFGLVGARGGQRKGLVLRFVAVTAPLAEEGERGPRQGPGAAGGEGRSERNHQLRGRLVPTAEWVGRHAGRHAATGDARGEVVGQAADEGGGAAALDRRIGGRTGAAHDAGQRPGRSGR